jgi:hypothetical protein
MLNVLPTQMEKETCSNSCTRSLGINGGEKGSTRHNISTPIWGNIVMKHRKRRWLKGMSNDKRNMIAAGG